IDVVDPDRGIPGDRGDVGHLDGDLVGSLAVALRTGQRQRVEPLPATAGAGEQERPAESSGRENAGTVAVHQAPPVTSRVSVRLSPLLSTLISGDGESDGGCTPGAVWVPGFCPSTIWCGSAVGVIGGAPAPYG